MSNYEFNIKAVLLARLSETDLDNLANFDCDDPEMNTFLLEEALEQQELGLNNTFLLYYKVNLLHFVRFAPIV